MQRANAGPPTLVPSIQLEDRFDPENPALGRQYGAHDGTYRYEEEERIKAANILFGKLNNKITRKIIDKVGGSKGLILEALGPSTMAALLAVPFRVANQVCNSFAVDKSEDMGLTWQHPGTGDASARTTSAISGT